MARGQGSLGGNFGSGSPGGKSGPGWLMGWKPLQSSIDKLESTISKDISALTKALASGMARGYAQPNLNVPNSLFSGRLASLNQIVTNLGVMAGQNISAMYGGKGNAGKGTTGSTGSGTPTPAKGNGGQTPPGGGGGGGGGSSNQYGGKGNGGITPAALGALITGGTKVGVGMRAAGLVAYGFNTVAKFGVNTAADQMSNELAAQQASLGYNGSEAAGKNMFLNNALGTAARPRSGMALNNTDALAAELMRIDMSGSVNRNDPRSANLDRGWRGLNLFNPTLGSSGSMAAMSDLLKPTTQQMTLGLKMGQLYGSDHAYVGDVELYKRFMGSLNPNRDPATINPEELQHQLGAFGSGQNLFNSLRLDPKTAGALKVMFQGINKLNTQGQMSLPEIQNLMDTASDGSNPGSKAAREKLGKSFTTSEFAANLETSASQRGLDAQINQKYIDNMKKATDGLTEFNTALATVTADGGPLKKLAEMSGGVAVYKAHPEAAAPGILAQTGHGAAASSQSKQDFWGNLFGWNKPADKPQSMTDRHSSGGAAAAPTTKQDPAKQSSAAGNASATANAVLASARSKIGMPYSWGGGGLKGPSYGSGKGAHTFGFDCSGLMEYAYGAGAGIDISRTTWSQMASPKGHDIGLNDVAPGDLIFTRGGEHVVMWTGSGYVAAPQTGRNVEEVSGKPPQILKARRFLNSSGTYHGNGLGPSAPSGSNNTQGLNMPGLLTNPGSGQEGGLGSGALGGVQGLANMVGSVEEIDLLREIFGSAIQGGNGLGLIAGMGTGGGASDPANPIKDDPAKIGKDPKAKKKGSGPLPKLPPGKGARHNIALGKQMAEAKGWTGSEFDDLYRLWMRESHWNELAMNQSSGAYGIPQSLPGNKMASAGRDWKTNPGTQIKWGLGYINNRYHDPHGAWAHSQKFGWYDKGAWNLPRDELAVVHKGEMIVPAKPAETIREVLQRDSGSKMPASSSSFSFGPNSVVIHLGSGVSEGSGRAVAAELMAELERLSTYKRIAQGV